MLVGRRVYSKIAVPTVTVGTAIFE